MRLVLEEGYEQRVGWNWTLSRMLASSGRFEVVSRPFPQLRELPRHARNVNFNLMELDGVLVALDTWDIFDPTALYHHHGLFAKGRALGDVAMILKIQHRPCPYWDLFERETGIPVRAWTVMPSAVFPLGCFRWRDEGHRYLATITGRNGRFGRQPWVDACQADSRFYAKGYNDKDDLEIYVEVLRGCRWGLILQGKGRNSDGKNRREAEFTSCGMPLAMNYCPHYPFEMEPGKHFVWLKSTADLALLDQIDPRPFAAASRQLWAEGFSPKGMASTFVQLVRQRCQRNLLQ